MFKIFLNALNNNLNNSFPTGSSKYILTLGLSKLKLPNISASNNSYELLSDTYGAIGFFM